MDPITLGTGAAASLASSIIGAVASSRANRKANDLIQTQRDENKRWYNTATNKDYTQRADVQAIFKRQKELLDEQYNRARKTAVVSGSTDESVALQKEAANKTLSDTATNIAAQSASYKDAVEQQYRAQDAALNQQQVAIEQNNANNIAKAAGLGIQAGLDLMGQGIGDTSTIKQEKA